MRTPSDVAGRAGTHAGCVAPLLLTLALAVGVAPSHAQPPPTLLTPERERITDQAIARDRAKMDELDRRLADADVTGLPPRAYTQALAQAWLAVAREQYALHDRSGLAEAAFQQAGRLAAVLEAGEATLDPPARIVPGTVRVRDDLWQLGEGLRMSRAFRCVAADVARFEIELVRAGHEATVRLEGDPHPVAEGLDARAEELSRAAADCGPASPVARRSAPARPSTTAAPEPSARATEPAPPPSPAPTASQVRDAFQQLGALGMVHFNHGTPTLSAVSAQVLDSVAAVMLQVPEIRATLVGHTDPRESASPNLGLGRRRALAVRDYLAAAGVDTARFVVTNGGGSNPVARGSGILEDALNRRVEIQYSGPGNLQIEARRQEMDLQFEIENPTAPPEPAHRAAPRPRKPTGASGHGKKPSPGRR